MWVMTRRDGWSSLREPTHVAPAAVVVGVRRMRIDCLIAGTGPDPVVLLHGGGIDSAALTYRHTLPALVQQHRVYAPDWPGYGHSSPPDRTPDLDFHIDLLEALLDTLALPRVKLVGVSLDGAAALGFALRRPKRVRWLALVASYGLGGAVPLGVLGALLVCLPGLTRAFRLYMLPGIINRIAHIAPVRRAIFNLFSQTWISYAGSPLVGEHTRERGPRPGDRAPFGRFEEGPMLGKGLYTILRGLDHQLLFFEGQASQAQANQITARLHTAMMRYRMPFQLHEIDRRCES